MAHYRIIGNALDYPWVIYVYAVTSSMNMNESAVNMHMVSYGRADHTTLKYGNCDPGSIPGAVDFLNLLLFSLIFWVPQGVISP
jgi:hypothetical protein